MIRNLLIVVFFAYLQILSCQTSDMKKDMALEALNELYGKACEILEFDFNRSRGIYNCLAIINDDPEIQFLTEFDRQSYEIISSNYPQLRWKQDYRTVSGNKLEKSFETIVHDVSFFSKLENTIDYKEIPAFEKITQALENSNKTEIRIYFFSDRDESFWERIRDFIQLHKDLNFESSSFQFNFYDPDFFSDKDLTSFDYGFKNSGSQFFEMEYFEYLNSRLLFTLDYEDEIPSREALEEALDTNPNKYIIRPYQF